MMKKQLSHEEAKKLGGNCPKCGNNKLVGTIAKDNESDETVIVDGVELIAFCCHNCNQYFVRTSKKKEINDLASEIYEELMSPGADYDDLRDWSKKIMELTKEEITKIYLLEVRVKGQNPHFQAVFANVSLAYNAKDKYLNDPACKKDLMEVDIHTYKVHTDLTVLDSSQPIASNKSIQISATRFDAYECRKCETIYDGITAKCTNCYHGEFIIHKKEER